jgi:hypothetical protein
MPAKTMVVGEKACRSFRPADVWGPEFTAAHH